MHGVGACAGAVSGACAWALEHGAARLINPMMDWTWLKSSRCRVLVHRRARALAWCPMHRRPQPDLSQHSAKVCKTSAARTTQKWDDFCQFGAEPEYPTRPSTDHQSSQHSFIDRFPELCNGSVRRLSVPNVKPVFPQLTDDGEVRHAGIDRPGQHLSSFQDRQVTIREHSDHATVFSSIRCLLVAQLTISPTWAAHRSSACRRSRRNSCL